jgi:hypothetical protein
MRVLLLTFSYYIAHYCIQGLRRVNHGSTPFFVSGIDQRIVDKVVARRGQLNAYEDLVPAKTGIQCNLTG